MTAATSVPSNVVLSSVPAFCHWDEKPPLLAESGTLRS